MTPEFLKQWHESGKQELAAQIEPESINDENRTVDCIWFTGADVDRYSWSDGPYILRFDPKGVDLSLLNQRAPVCDNHSMYQVNDQMGVVEKAWKSGSNYMATLRFKRSTELTGPRPEVDGLWQDIKDKIVSKFSMGVEILESIETRNKDNKLEVRTATAWRPFEISLAPIPADFGTCTLSSQPKPDSRQPTAPAVLNCRVREAEILRLR
jgi:hypothetical protein